MKKLFTFGFSLFVLLLAAGCGGSEYRAALNYLKVSMPAGDRDTLDGALLRENVKYALRAREEFPWTKSLPDSIFLNEVLPYAVVDEPRESWRPKFYDIFAPKVRGAATIEEAIALVNKDINLAVGVEYDTRRRRTNQSPSESMEQGMASCTGLSIILVDAFRSVGIPARFAGTAAWWDDRGNHSWVEVWIDGKWWFTEFYPDPAGLDNSWFLADAGRGDPADRQHGVWAVSWRPTAYGAFPMVWSEGSTAVHGVNVTDRYAARYQEVMDAQAAAGTHIEVRFSMYGVDGAGAGKTGAGESEFIVIGGSNDLMVIGGTSTTDLLLIDGAAKAADGTAKVAADGKFAPEDRVAVNVDVFADGLQLGGGRTSGPRDDAARYLTFSLPKNTEISFRWVDSEGGAVEKTVFIAEDPLEIRGWVAKN